ncbi:MAG TPA: NAD-dependent epimerase/dehydratase family protein [Sphingomonas sp.]
MSDSRNAILVTGAAGFIGAALSRTLLERGDSVIGIDNFNDYYDPALKRARADTLAGFGDRFEMLELDFGNTAALNAALEARSFDRIAHLGAQAGVRYSLINPHAYAHSNLTGHLNLLEIARHRRVDHMVYASSSSVYGGNDSFPFRVEDRVDHPVSLYAATKKSNELMSEAYANLYRIPLTGLRFFTVYGPWGRPDMAPWLFTSRILAGEPITVFNHGQMRRDFTYIDDIIAGVVASLDHPPSDDGLAKAGGSIQPHAIYNIGNNRSEELGHFIDVIEKACGRPAVRDYQPMQAGDVVATAADISAIERDLGYRPTTSIDVGIPRFVEWYRGYNGRR